MNNKLFFIAVNFSATLILIAIITAPMYFAHNFAQVAGVKTQSPYLIVSEIDKFPNLTYQQVGETFKINFVKLGPSQAFLSVLIINNPTSKSETYSIKVSDEESRVFFGEDPKNQLTKISVPPTASVPISLLSRSDESTAETVEFKIEAN